MKSKSIAYFGIVCATVFLGCQSKDQIPETYNTMEQVSKISIYQVMVRLFGNKNTLNKPNGTSTENGVGKFDDVSDVALASLRKLGITHIWFTGVLEHATLSDYPSSGIVGDHPFVVKGRAGSPYSIKDYYDVDPDLAVDVPKRMQEFENLIARTHRNGMKALIDFVPNHVARQYKSDAKPQGVKDLGESDDPTKPFLPANNFYYLPGTTFQPPWQHVQKSIALNLPGISKPYLETPAKVTGNDQFTAAPGVNEWFEAVKLNYGVNIQDNRKTFFDPVPKTWEMMREILAFWAKKKVDGFRCDMAEMVPVEFWTWVIPQIKLINPSIIFIAEIYNPAQYENYSGPDGFDFLYDKVQLYDTLRLLMEGKGSSVDVPRVQQSLKKLSKKMLHFMENHDEQRIASKQFAGDPWKGMPAMLISATIDQGPVMVYFGQEVGEPAVGAEGFGGDDGRTTMFDYWGVPEHQKWMNGGKFDGGKLSLEQRQLREWYGELLKLSTSNPAIAEGSYEDLTEYNLTQKNISNRVVTYLRYSGGERLLMVAGFNNKTESAKISIPRSIGLSMGLDSLSVYAGRDLLGSGVDVGFDNSLTCSLDIAPFGAYVIKIK
jgi:glycosidase